MEGALPREEAPGSVVAVVTLEVGGPVREGSGAGRLGTGCLESRKQSEVFGTGVKGGRCLGSGKRPHRRVVEQRPRGMPLLNSEWASPVPSGQGSLGTEVEG